MIYPRSNVNYYTLRWSTCPQTFVSNPWPSRGFGGERIALWQWSQPRSPRSSTRSRCSIWSYAASPPSASWPWGTSPCITCSSSRFRCRSPVTLWASWVTSIEAELTATSGLHRRSNWGWSRSKKSVGEKRPVEGPRGSGCPPRLDLRPWRPPSGEPRPRLPIGAAFLEKSIETEKLRILMKDKKNRIEAEIAKFWFQNSQILVERSQILVEKVNFYLKK